MPCVRAPEQRGAAPIEGVAGSAGVVPVKSVRVAGERGTAPASAAGEEALVGFGHIDGKRNLKAFRSELVRGVVDVDPLGADEFSGGTPYRQTERLLLFVVPGESRVVRGVALRL